MSRLKPLYHFWSKRYQFTSCRAVMRNMWGMTDKFIPRMSEHSKFSPRWSDTDTLLSPHADSLVFSHGADMWCEKFGCVLTEPPAGVHRLLRQFPLLVGGTGGRWLPASQHDHNDCSDTDCRLNTRDSGRRAVLEGVVGAGVFNASADFALPQKAPRAERESERESRAATVIPFPHVEESLPGCAALRARA